MVADGELFLRTVLSICKRHGLPTGVRYTSALRSSQGIIRNPQAHLGVEVPHILAPFAEAATHLRLASRMGPRHERPPRRDRQDNKRHRPSDGANRPSIPRSYKDKCTSKNACLRWHFGVCSLAPPHLLTKRDGTVGTSQLSHTCPLPSCSGSSGHTFTDCPNS
jgi:hypothetical protein